MLMDAVMEETNITATAGIGTNLYLAKIALDIISKHVPDNIGMLTEKRIRNIYGIISLYGFLACR